MKFPPALCLRAGERMKKVLGEVAAAKSPPTPLFQRGEGEVSVAKGGGRERAAPEDRTRQRLIRMICMS